MDSGQDKLDGRIVRLLESKYVEKHPMVEVTYQRNAQERKHNVGFRIREFWSDPELV